MTKKKFVLYILFFLLSFFCKAHESAPITYFGIEQGLSNNAVTSIFQDHNGFMWFGTYDGLNRYDGYQFKVYRNIIGNKSSLVDNHVSVIEGDAAHHIWIGCEKGASIFNPVTADFSTPYFITTKNNTLRQLNDGIRAIQKVSATGSMLVGTFQSGLILFEKENYTGLQIPFSPRGESKNVYGVTAIAVDVSQNFAWVFIPESGLCRLDIKRKNLVVINRSIKKADCLKVDKSGTLWLGNDDGLFYYNAQANTFSSNVLPYANKVVSIYQDRNSMLWIASDGGGVWYMPVGAAQPKPYVLENGKPVVNSNAVYAIYEDNKSGKWFGTLRGGINRVQSNTNLFRKISFNNPLQNNSVNDFILSFCEAEGGNVWIGTDGAGLRYWDRRKNSFTPYWHTTNSGSISSNFITSILTDAKGDLWITTWFGGVNRVRKGTQVFEKFTCYNSARSAIENNAWLVFEDAYKTIWVSTTNEGTLYTFDASKNQFDLFDSKLHNIQALAEDRKGNLWGGNYTALIQIDRFAKKHRSYSIGYTVRSIYEDERGNFWVGTDGGGLLLFNRSNGSFQRFTTTEGLPSNTILRILEDEKHNLWLSTYNGLCKFNVVAKTCQNFSQSDGLQSNQFSFNAALALKSGEFLFGGIKGFNVFYPDSIYDRTDKPNIFLTGLKINNKPVEEDDQYITKRDREKIEKIKIPYNEAILAFDFVALEYSGADKIKYAYLLEGWDKHWNVVNNIRSANYSRLEEGDYVFKIKVTNSAGVWGEETKLLTIAVLPPWYRTWWAYLLYILAFGSVIYTYILYNRRQEKLKYDIKLAVLEKEKEKELTEKRLSFFTNISHEFRTPLTLIINPIKDLLRKAEEPEDQHELNTVNRNARRLLSLVDQLLIFRKAEQEADNMRFSKVNFHQFCYEVYLCFVQQAKANGQEFIFDGTDTEIDLYIDRQKMEIALYNLLSNAIKYTPNEGKIVFSVKDNGDSVEVLVADNGYGIPEEASSRLFEKFYQVTQLHTPVKGGFGIGLYLVKHFIEAHKGQVSFQSEAGKGTQFLVLLKKGKEHLAGSVIVEDQKTEPVSSPENERALAEERVKPVKTEAKLEDLVTARQTVVVADDNADIRRYLEQILSPKYNVLEASNGQEALAKVQSSSPDLVISDIRMDVMDGIELCKQIKTDASLSHIPVILLTGSYGPDVELKSTEVGADIYITKPFDKELLLAKVENLFKSRSELQNYFFNEITLKKNSQKISPEYKEFLDRCIAIVEEHLDDDNFNIKTLAKEIGMSHSNLYKRVRTISGQSVTSFIRYIRLRKAAELLLKGDCNVNQAAFQVGIADIKYFRAQFSKLFGMNPSDYIKKYRQSFNETYSLSDNARKSRKGK